MQIEENNATVECYARGITKTSGDRPKKIAGGKTMQIKNFTAINESPLERHGHRLFGSTEDCSLSRPRLCNGRTQRTIARLLLALPVCVSAR